MVGINIDRNKLYKKERIKLKDEISVFFNSKLNVLRFYSSYYSLFVYENSLGYSRFAVSVRRNTCNAPKRNRAKRIVREIFRTNKKLIAQGYDYFIFVRKECDLNYSLYEDDLISLFKRVSK